MAVHQCHPVQTRLWSCTVASVSAYWYVRIFLFVVTGLTLMDSSSAFGSPYWLLPGTLDLVLEPNRE